jgi:hypothetical protein
MRYGMALRQLSRHRIVQAQFARSAVRLSFNTYQRIRLAHKMSKGLPDEMDSIESVRTYLKRCISIKFCNAQNPMKCNDSCARQENSRNCGSNFLHSRLQRIVRRTKNFTTTLNDTDVDNNDKQTNKQTCDNKKILLCFI